MAAAPLTLDPLLAAVRARSTGIDSQIHGELHWRTVGANGLWLAGSVDGEPPEWAELRTAVSMRPAS